MKHVYWTVIFLLSALSLSGILHKAGEYCAPDYARCATVVNNLAYMGDGYGLSIIDVSNPQTPVLLSRLAVYSGVKSIKIVGHMAYVVDMFIGFEIIDVSNPYAPNRLSHFNDIEGIVTAISIENSYAYLAMERTGLLVVNISNSLNPTLVSTLPSSGFTRAIESNGNYVYLLDSIDGLMVIDVSNPAIPHLESSLAVPDAYTMDLAGNLVYIASDSLRIIDVSNPQSPQLLQNSNLNFNMLALRVSENRAYITTDYDLRIYDISNAQNPLLLGRYIDYNCPWSIDVQNNIVYLVSGFAGLEIIDASDMSNPYILNTYPSHTSSLFIDDNLAYISGFQILDLSNPINPVLIGSCSQIPNAASHITVADNIAYLSMSNCLFTVDVSNPQNPVYLSAYSFSSDSYWIGSISILGNYALASSMNSLAAFDISNPSEIVLVSEHFGGATDAKVSGNIAYVSAWSEGLKIFDVTNPPNPILLSTLDTQGFANSIIVANNVAVISDYTAGVQLIDVTDPMSPTLIRTILPHPTSLINRCYLKDNYLFILDDNWNEISIYNISNLHEPLLLRILAWNYQTRDMCLVNNVLYTANGNNGLNILDFNTLVFIDDHVIIPTSELKLSNYPNPFNPSTTINFDLPQDGLVTLDIYNIRGQKVKSLLNECFTSGTHEVLWNGTDGINASVSSGVYFARIKSGGETSNRKLVLLK